MIQFLCSPQTDFVCQRLLLPLLSRGLSLPTSAQVKPVHPAHWLILLWFLIVVVIIITQAVSISFLCVNKIVTFGSKETPDCDKKSGNSTL